MMREGGCPPVLYGGNMKKLLIVFASLILFGCSNQMKLSSYQLTEISPVIGYNVITYHYDGPVDPTNILEIKEKFKEVGVVDFDGIYYYSNDNVYFIFYREE